MEKLQGHRVAKVNYRATEWPKFHDELVEQLAAIPGLGALVDETQYQKAVDDLTAALQTAIERAVPLSKDQDLPALTPLVE